MAPARAGQKRRLSSSSLDSAEPDRARPFTGHPGVMLASHSVSHPATHPAALRPNASVPFDALPEDVLRHVFRLLPTADLANVSSVSTRLHRVVKSYLGFPSATLKALPAPEGDLEGPERFAHGVCWEDRLVVCNLDAEPACWIFEITTEAARWERKEVRLGDLKSAWRPLAAPAVVVGSFIYFYGGHFLPSPSATRSGQNNFPETPHTIATGPSSHESSQSSRFRKEDYELSDSLYRLDLTTWVLDEVGRTDGSDESSQGSSVRAAGWLASQPQSTPPFRPLLRPSVSAGHGSVASRSSTSSSILCEWPPALAFHTFNKIQEKWLVVFGGMRANSEGEHDVYIYDLRSGRWTRPRVELDFSPPVRFGHASCVLRNDGNKIFVFGGSRLDAQNTTYNDLWKLAVLSAKSVRWTHYRSPAIHSTPSPPSSHPPKTLQRESTDSSIATTQLASQGSSSGGLRMSSSAAVMPGGPSAASDFSAPSSASSIDYVVTSTGPVPWPRADATMLAVSAHRFILLGGRYTTEVDIEGVFPDKSIDGMRKRWEETLGYSWEGGDVFDDAIDHWSNVAIEGGQGTFPTEGVAVWDEKYGRIVVAGARVDLARFRPSGAEGRTTITQSVVVVSTEQASSQAFETMKDSFSQELPVLIPPSLTTAASTTDDTFAPSRCLPRLGPLESLTLHASGSGLTGSIPSFNAERGGALPLTFTEDVFSAFPIREAPDRRVSNTVVWVDDDGRFITKIQEEDGVELGSFNVRRKETEKEEQVREENTATQGLGMSWKEEAVSSSAWAGVLQLVR